MSTPRKSDPPLSPQLKQNSAQKKAPQKAPQKAAQKAAQKTAQRSVQKPAQKPAQKPVQKPAQGSASPQAPHPEVLSKPWARLVRQQAQRGNLKALTTLLRQQLKRHHPEGRIRVQVTRKNSILLVHLTGATAPSRPSVMAWAASFFSKFAVVGVSGARILSHRSGFPQAVWTEQIAMTPRQSSLPIPMALGAVFAGGTLLVLLWGIGAMMRGPSESIAQGETQATTQADPAESTATKAVAPEPDYKVIREEIFDGRRIQIDTDDPNLSREECIAIAAKFLEEAGTDGQVVVQKPNPKSPWNGKRAPFCANNNNGYGTFFNSEYF